MQKIIKLSNVLDYFGLYKEAIELNNLIKRSDVNIANTQQSIQNSLMMAFSKRGDGSYYIQNNLIPSKIANLPAALSAFAASKGRGDAKFKTNGATRGLDKAIGGGGGRVAGSLHGLGFAHDVIINTGKFTEEYNIELNSKVIKSDPQIIHIMKEFADTNNLTWGGNWSKGGRIPVVYNGKSIDVGIGEIHHFEINDGELVSSLPEIIKNFMTKIGIQPGDIVNSEKRKILYEEILKAIGGAPLSTITAPVGSVQSQKTENELTQNSEMKQRVYGPTFE